MDSDTIELVVLIAVAALVLYRLRAIIGTRSGHEGPPEYVRRHQEAKERAGPAAAAEERQTDDQNDDDDQDAPENRSRQVAGISETSAAALSKITRLEPDFDLDEFADGARGAYEMILMAYEEGDRQTLRDLLAPDVFSAFESGISAREEQNLRVEARFIGVRESKVEEVAFEDGSNIADVTVRFVGELITSVHDAENRVVEGDPNEVRRQSDVWTFSREMGSVDPNWLLIGTGA